MSRYVSALTPLIAGGLFFVIMWVALHLGLPGGVAR